MATTTDALMAGFANHKAQNTTPDYLLGKVEILRRATEGDLSCKFLAAWGFYEGRFGFPFDTLKANEWLKAASVKNKPAGDCAIAFGHQHGAGNADKIDIDTASEQYIGVASRYLPAKFLYVAITHEYPYQSVEDKTPLSKEDIASVLKDLSVCVDANFPPALTLMGRLCLTGEWGVTKDVQKGIDLLTRAAGSGSGDSEAQLYLGHSYQKGSSGIGKDTDVARGFIKMAIDQGAAVSDADRKFCNKKQGCILV